MSARNRTCAPLVLLATLGACADPLSPPAAPRLEVVQGAPERALPGDRLPFVIVRAVDAHGAPISGVPLSWSGDGTVTPSADTTGLDGLAAATWVLPRYDENPFKDVPQNGPPGTFALRASIPGEAATTFRVEAKAFTVERMDVGFDLACGIRERTLWCWGQPGLPPLATGPVPITTTLAGQVAEVAVGDFNVCVAAPDGRVSCIGRGSPEAFVAVPGAPPLRELMDNGPRMCGLARADSTAWCWTWYDAQVTGARQISPALRFERLARGASASSPEFDHMCGLDGEGGAWCWGNNREGQLGDGSTTDRDSPVRVAGDLHFRQITVGSLGTCGLTARGDVWCWGRLSLAVPSPVPVRAPVSSGGWTDLFAEGTTLYLLGLRLGAFHGFGSQYPLFQLFQDFPVRTFAAGGIEGCAMLADGQVFCTESLTYGINPSSLPLDPFTPVPVPGGGTGRP